MPKAPLKLNELHKRVKAFGVIATASARGKGSEIILVKPVSPGSKSRPQYPIKNHGMGAEISIPVINAVLRRFQINPNDFWK
jgi:hypothetical protein